MTARHRTQPNDRAQRAAAKLLGIAPDITRAVEHLREELSVLGYPARSDGPKVAGGSSSTPTERDGTQAAHLSGMREDLRDTIVDIGQRIDALVRLVRHILGEAMPTADGEALCADVQKGREGAITWGDPTCTELPLGNDNGGRRKLCARCEKREMRWRKEHGLTFRGESAA